MFIVQSDIISDWILVAEPRTKEEYVMAYYILNCEDSMKYTFDSKRDRTNFLRPFGIRSIEAAFLLFEID